MEIKCKKCSAFLTEVTGETKVPVIVEQRIPCRRCDKTELILRFTPQGLTVEYRPWIKKSASGR